MRTQKHWVVLWDGHICWYDILCPCFYSPHPLALPVFLSFSCVCLFSVSSQCWCLFLPCPTGLQTKLMQNCGRTKFKRTSIDKLMNTLVLWVSLTLCTFLIYILLTPQKLHTYTRGFSLLDLCSLVTSGNLFQHKVVSCPGLMAATRLTDSEGHVSQT